MTINHGKIEISNPDGKRPKYGEGLNKSAKISLYGMAPKPNKSIDEYVKKLENVCEQMGTEFLAYDPDWGGGNGLWQFRTNDFCDKNQWINTIFDSFTKIDNEKEKEKEKE